MRIDHIGYAVKNIEKARAAFEELGFVFDELIDDTDRNIFIQFGRNDGYCVELVSPDGNGESPADYFLGKVGPTPYHICYRTDDIERDIADLTAKKFKVIVPLAPAMAFGGCRVVFMMNRALGMIEIVEDDRDGD